MEPGTSSRQQEWNTSLRLQLDCGRGLVTPNQLSVSSQSSRECTSAHFLSEVRIETRLFSRCSMISRQLRFEGIRWTHHECDVVEVNVEQLSNRFDLPLASIVRRLGNRESKAHAEYVRSGEYGSDVTSRLGIRRTDLEVQAVCRYSSSERPGARSAKQVLRPGAVIQIGDHIRCLGQAAIECTCANLLPKAAEVFAENAESCRIAGDLLSPVFGIAKFRLRPRVASRLRVSIIVLHDGCQNIRSRLFPPLGNLDYGGIRIVAPHG